MTLLDRFVRQIDLKNLTECVAVGHAVKAERTDQQMHIQRFEASAEYPLFGTSTQDHAQGEIGRASGREKSVSGRVDLGGRRIMKKKKHRSSIATHSIKQKDH